jgi:Vacuolar sorting-associated protein 13, extended-chorein
MYSMDETKNSGMISFTICPGNRDNEFQASGRSNGHDFKISGTCSPGETQSTITVSFKRTFAARAGPQYWDGQFDSSTDTITGTVSFDEERTTTSFFLKRTSPDQLCFRPSPAAFEANKAQALWSFALSAARGYVRQRSWSWSFFRERRDTRKRFIQLYIRDTAFGKPLDEAENTEFSQILSGLTTFDSNFYYSLGLYQIRITPRHGKVYCLSSLSLLADKILL